MLAHHLARCSILLEAEHSRGRGGGLPLLRVGVTVAAATGMPHRVEELSRSPRPLWRAVWRGGVACAAAAVLLCPTLAGAQPHDWPFDFDPQLAADPTAVQSGLDDLGAGLPGLPEQMQEIVLGDTQLYFDEEVSAALLRARDAGPGSQPPTSAVPELCAGHASFVFPNDLLQSATPDCQAAEQSIAAAFNGLAKTCVEVEYPESYVDDHPPGYVDFDTVASFEGLIAVAGEALRHLDYPDGLLPDDFLPTARNIIAKIRHDTLVQQIAARQAAYDQASQTLSSSAACFDPAKKASLESSIATLQAELSEVGQQLEQLYQDGLTQAAADRAAAQGQCRQRNEQLLHPALTDRERIQLAFYIGGVYWRMRGAGLIAYPPDPEQGLLRRILYVKYPFQLIGDLTGGTDAEGVGDSILFDENWGWDEWWDMGTTPGGGDKYFDLVGMTNRGKRGVNVVGPQLANRGYDIRWLVSGGLQMGPCYYFAWEQLAGFRLGDDLADPYMWFIEWPTSIGELCEGAALGVGLANTLLWGKPIPPEQCEAPCSGGGCGGAGVGGDCPGCQGGAGPAPSQGGASSTAGEGEAASGCSCALPIGSDRDPTPWSWLLAVLGVGVGASFVRGGARPVATKRQGPPTRPSR